MVFVEVTSKDKVTSASCFSATMTKERGVVECESISEAVGRCVRNWWHGLVLPDFDSIKCGTATKGAFLRKYIKFT